jgi:hypothetical protein
LLGDLTEVSITGAAEVDSAAFAAALGDRASSSQGPEAGGGGKALAVVAEVGQQRRRQIVACTGQGGEDLSVWMLAEELCQPVQGCLLLLGRNSPVRYIASVWYT